MGRDSARPSNPPRRGTHAIRRAVRNLGQQVLQLAFVSPRPFDETVAVEEFTHLLQDVIVPTDSQRE